MKKSKLFAALLGAVMLMMSCFTLLACAPDEQVITPTQEYTVTFNTNGGSAITALKIKSGEKASKPTNPTKAGFTFDNWYKESALTTVFDFTAEAIKADTTVYAKWNAVAGTIAWVKPTEKVLIYDDMAKNREDRLDLDTMLAGKVYATEDGEKIETAINELPATLVRDSVTGLLPIGEYDIGYYAIDSILAEHNTTLKVEVVDASAHNYYLFGKNSSAYSTPAPSGGEKWWNGGTGIRVSPDNAFTIPVGASEMPASLLNSSNSKLIDFDDPALIINKSETGMTFKVNDVSGVHILMDESGFVKMMYEGIQADFWNIDGQSKKTSAEFGALDITLEQGDIYFVIGNTLTGNWYSDYSELEKDTNGNPKEKHWADGRFVARATVGGLRYGNVAMIKKGDTLITTPYTNQLPYIKAKLSDVTVIKGATLTNANFADAAFFDDKVTGTAVVYEQDVAVLTENITIDFASVNTAVLGDYTITYTVKDSLNQALTATFTRKVIVSMPANYIWYGTEENKTVFEASAIKLNATNDDIAFRINTDPLKNTTVLKYDNTFKGVKPSNAAESNKRPIQFANFVVYGVDGNVKAFINAAEQKLVTMKEGVIDSLAGAGTDQMRFFKLNAEDTNVVAGAYEMQEGDVLYTAFHTGTVGNLRDYFGGLTLAIKNKAGTTLAEKTIALNIVGYTA